MKDAMHSFFLLLVLALAGTVALPGNAGDDEKKEPAKEEEIKPVDLGKVLRESKEFAAECKKYKIEWSEGRVSAVGEIIHRGGGPCEYLVGVWPSKPHETIVLLDDGPFTGEGRRPREYIKGLATNLNNAFLAAGFEKGSPFGWDRKTGEVFPPKGPSVHVYCEWTEDKGKTKLARMSDWLWNHKKIRPMIPGQFVYTGSEIWEEEQHDGGVRKWLGAEMDGLIVAVLSTSSTIIDHTEAGGLDNGVYEAIAVRIPPLTTRVNVVFSAKELDGIEKYEPLKLPKELEEERKKLRAAEEAEAAAKKKAEPDGDGKSKEKEE